VRSTASASKRCSAFPPAHRGPPVSRMWASHGSGCGGLDKAGERQICNVGNIGVSKTPAQFQHGAASLQEYIPTLDRHHAGGTHDGCKLLVGKGHHGIREKPESSVSGL
jgi:hypothetical protein